MTRKAMTHVSHTVDQDSPTVDDDSHTWYKLRHYLLTKSEGNTTY